MKPLFISLLLTALPSFLFSQKKTQGTHDVRNCTFPGDYEEIPEETALQYAGQVSHLHIFNAEGNKKPAWNKHKSQDSPTCLAIEGSLFQMDNINPQFPEAVFRFKNLRSLSVRVYHTNYRRLSYAKLRTI